MVASVTTGAPGERLPAPPGGGLAPQRRVSRSHGPHVLARHLGVTLGVHARAARRVHDVDGLVGLAADGPEVGADLIDVAGRDQLGGALDAALLLGELRDRAGDRLGQGGRVRYW